MISYTGTPPTEANSTEAHQGESVATRSYSAPVSSWIMRTDEGRHRNVGSRLRWRCPEDGPARITLQAYLGVRTRCVRFCRTGWRGTSAHHYHPRHALRWSR